MIEQIIEVQSRKTRWLTEETRNQLVYDQDFDHDLSLLFNEAGLTGDLIDMAQVQTDIFNKSALLRVNINICQQERHAEERFNKGLNGICENCGCHIPEDRLRAA